MTVYLNLLARPRVTRLCHGKLELGRHPRYSCQPIYKYIKTINIVVTVVAGAPLHSKLIFSLGYSYASNIKYAVKRSLTDLSFYLCL